jgi:hypothetical protein
MLTAVNVSPLLYVVSWKEPSGIKEQATTLQLSPWEAARWLRRLRPQAQSVKVEPYRSFAGRR